MNVGFLGLGAMGAGIAGSLARAGNTMLVWNRTSAAAQKFATETTGARAVGEPKGLAGCDVVFAMLANDEATRASIIDSGLLAALPNTCTLVNCATISLDCARELAAAFERRGVGYIAAPVLGRPNVAAEGNLNVIAAGAASALARVQPLLDAIGQKTWHMGADPTLANVAKIGANFMIASAIETMGEAFAIAQGNGLAPAALLDLVSNTLFAAPVYKNYGASIVAETFEPPGFVLHLGRKDVELARSAGKAAGAKMPVGDALAGVFERAIAAGDGDKDWSAVVLQAKPAAAATRT